MGRQVARSPTSDDTYSTSALALALKSMFNAEQAGSRDLLADIQLGDQHLYVLVDNGQVCVPRQPPAEPDLTLTASPAVFSALFAGHLDIDAAVETGAATVDGSRRDACRFFKIFHMPRPAPDHGGAT